MDYEHFEIRNKHAVPVGRPVRTGGVIASWTDSYVQNGSGKYFLTLAEKVESGRIEHLMCCLNAEDSTVAGMPMDEFTKRVMKATRLESLVSVAGQLSLVHESQRLSKEKIAMFVDVIDIA